MLSTSDELRQNLPETDFRICVLDSITKNIVSSSEIVTIIDGLKKYSFPVLKEGYAPETIPDLIQSIAKVTGLGLPPMLISISEQEQYKLKAFNLLISECIPLN